jgi:hypothetical protein
VLRRSKGQVKQVEIVGRLLQNELKTTLEKRAHDIACISRNLPTVFKVIFRGKAIPLQAWRGPEGFRRSRLPDFRTLGT